MKPSRSLKFLTFLASCILSSSSCNKEDGIVQEPMGIVQLEITDAPIDDDQVAGAFVTINQVRIARDSNILTEKHSIDLLAYRGGNTKTLVINNVPAGHYDHLELVLDLQEDAFGSTPGCYVTTKDGKKHNLYPSSNLTTTLTIPADITISPAEKTAIVMDFDLRRLIKSGTGGEIKYQFVDSDRMELGIRVLEKDKTGTIKGTFNREAILPNKIIALIYFAGSYHPSREIKSTQSNDLHFQSAQNSALVSSDGSFVIPFLEKGTYELIFALYSSVDGANLLGVLDASANTGIDLSHINVEAGNQTSITGQLLQVQPL